MFAAVAAGPDNGGYSDIKEAADNMAGLKDKSWSPNKDNKEMYDLLFAEYKLLHDYFGRGDNDVMKRLKKLSEKAKS